MNTQFNTIQKRSIQISPAKGFIKKILFCAISIPYLLAISIQSRADNGVMMQYFEWYLPADGTLWQKVQAESVNLQQAGITALWLPPAYKGVSGASDVGYGVYDMYDLGEFNQHGSIRTKYGTKQQYVDAINAAHAAGLQIYGDVVFNHRAGADATESVTAVRVDSNNRNNEYGGDVQIDAWTQFNFDARANQYSSFKWKWYHFDGVDWAENLQENAVFKFRGFGKNWDWEVDTEKGNYDYLMAADVDFEHPDVVSELKNWGEWYVNTTQVDGFRLDAIKHIKFQFFADWLDHLRNVTGKSLFTVGEYWTGDTSRLHNYITATSGKMSLFDAPLHYRFQAASNAGGGYDMRTLWDNTLMKDQPELAVTLVENHDTQPCQALDSPVQDWFKPMAYAFILLRAQGYPNIFYADYYGANYTTSDNACDNTHIQMKSFKSEIDTLLSVRQNFAWGEQIDYLDDADIIGWTRLGDAAHPQSMAVIMTDARAGSKWMNVGKANTTFSDVTGNRQDQIISNSSGWANFPVNAGSYSVWVEAGNNPPPPQGGNVQVNFSCHNGYTYWGQNVYVVGNQSVLGNWNPANAVKLDPSNYPTWDGSFDLPANTSVEWKCIKKEGGNVVWQNGSNNQLLTPASGSVNTSGGF